MSKVEWGFAGQSHDAALAVFVDDKLEWAAHSERYSRIKNDKNLNAAILNEAVELYGEPETIYFHEKPWLKKTRQLYSGQYNLLRKESPWDHISGQFVLSRTPSVINTGHHHSHAAAYYTSGFDNATILSIDSIGEWDTFTVWEGRGDELIKRHATRYPHSLGIWYSAMTQRIGLKPQEHEYILMGMAALGDPHELYWAMIKDFFEVLPHPSLGFGFKLAKNLHRGCLDWRPYLNTPQDFANIAAATQLVYSNMLRTFLETASKKYPSRNLVLTGGCALNCAANTQAFDFYDNVWIMPNPGDAGSAITSVLAHKKMHMDWTTSFLGHDIPGKYPVSEVVANLLQDRLTGVAAGKAEFGPRALGHRSLLADPRGADVKDLVNGIKQREEFRPFAPMILEEHVHEYFDVPAGWTSPYMQFTPMCIRTEEIPAVVHFDGTSRVQTVPNDGSDIRQLLEHWYEKTGCPLLLNTSLNVKGEPLVNTVQDALRWQQEHCVTVCLPATAKRADSAGLLKS